MKKFEYMFKFEIYSFEEFIDMLRLSGLDGWELVSHWEREKCFIFMREME